MSDREIQALARAYADGDDSLAIPLTAARVRAGIVTQANLDTAAALGDKVSLACGATKPERRIDMRYWPGIRAALDNLSDEALVRFHVNTLRLRVSGSARDLGIRNGNKDLATAAYVIDHATQWLSTHDPEVARGVDARVDEALYVDGHKVVTSGSVLKHAGDVATLLENVAGVRRGRRGMPAPPGYATHCVVVGIRHIFKWHSPSETAYRQLCACAHLQLPRLPRAHWPMRHVVL